MNNPKFTGVWIPKEVFNLKTLSPSAKFLYGIVDALDNEDGCYASNGYISTALGLSDRQIRALLKELEDALLVRRTVEGGNRVIRTVEKIALGNALADGQVTKSFTTGAEENFRRGRKKTSVGGGRKLPPDSKEDNKEDKDTPLTPKVDVPLVGNPLPFSSNAFRDAWFSWVDYRKELRKPLKQSSVELQWRQMILWGEIKSIDSIKQSITNGWTGLFEPKNNYITQKQPLTKSDHNDF